ncbi:hypothetical protein BV22DRAFT_1038948 [Leucogyrophana mollusca]|uniref:Uncharacterized protein n=1 Tax=Leucogyrophana mollusca TaxID=85980 RepID=A0ACB8B5X7_9AGAM|nr:hypothetical protein BV22DRAFT_1038948 [Leucogyrophana mollusca]
MSVPESFAEDLWIRGAFGIAGYTFIVWDYLLTLEDEFKYIWKAPWTVSKATFLVNRYGNLACQTFIRVEEVGLLSHGSQMWCHRFNIFTTLYMLIATESIHILVLMRAWAIWGCTRRVAAWLISIYVTYLFLQLGMTIFGTGSKNFQMFQYLEDIGVCVGVMPQYVWVIFLASFVLDTTVFALTMRSLHKYSRICRRLYPSQLLHRLFKDALIFFLVSTFNNFFIIILWTVYAKRPQYFLAVTFSLPLLSMAGQRLVLNLRGLQARSYTTGELSREVDRQILAFEQGAGANDLYAPPVLWREEDPDDELEAVEADVEMVEIRIQQGSDGGAVVEGAVLETPQEAHIR